MFLQKLVKFILINSFLFVVACGTSESYMKDKFTSMSTKELCQSIADGDGLRFQREWMKEVAKNRGASCKGYRKSSYSYAGSYSGGSSYRKEEKNTGYGKSGTTYNRYGNVTYGSDGSTYQNIGGTTFGSDGTTYRRYGNVTYGSDGSSYQHIGNNTFSSSGDVCSSFGTTTICN